jgi:heterodisulfide reductase subunit B
MPDYELASRAVLRALGIEVRLVQEPLCCGAPIAESFTADWVHLAAYNRARVQSMGCDTVVTLCGSCTNALTRAGVALQRDDLRAEAARRLKPAGLAIDDGVTVKHLVKLLSEKVEAISSRMVQHVGLRVAITNPCQAFRPGHIMGYTNAMEPQDMRRLIEMTGAEIIPYGGEDECCGATLFMSDPRLSLAAGRRKLDAAREADFLVHSCGNCHLLLRHLQHRIAARDPDTGKPVRKRALFLPQILGLAMGLTPVEVGLRQDV